MSESDINELLDNIIEARSWSKAPDPIRIYLTELEVERLRARAPASLDFDQWLSEFVVVIKPL